MTFDFSCYKDKEVTVNEAKKAFRNIAEYIEHVYQQNNCTVVIGKTCRVVSTDIQIDVFANMFCANDIINYNQYTDTIVVQHDVIADSFIMLFHEKKEYNYDRPNCGITNIMEDETELLMRFKSLVLLEAKIIIHS